MEDREFIEKIYGPYSEAWKVIKILQDNSRALDEVLKDYIQKVDEYDNKYSDNEFAQLLRKNLLLRADDVIVQMGGRQ